MQTRFAPIAAAALIAGIVLFGSSAYASLVTALPDGTIIPIPRAGDGSGFNTSPVTTPVAIAPGVSFTTDGQYSWFGFQSNFGFGSNGGWDSSQTPSILTSGLGGTLTVSFANAVQSVGAFLNYDTGSNPTGIVIAAYDISGTLIENATVSFSTGGGTNTGAFYGFTEADTDIAKFTVTGLFAGFTQLTTAAGSPAPAPEPATLALLGTGLAGTILARRRRKR